MDRTQKHLLDFYESQRNVFEKYLVTVKTKPSKKAIHKFRVAIRRMRSAHWILRQNVEKKKIKELDRHLKKLSHALGEIRELDVAIENAKQYGLKASSLKKQRIACHRHLCQFLTRKQRKIEREVDAVANAIRFIENPDFEEMLAHLMEELMRRCEHRFRKASDIHRLRIAVKRARYAIEAMGLDATPLLEAQEVLGKAHDLQVLRLMLKTNRKVKRDQTHMECKAIELAPKVLEFATHYLN